jgi:hypothetical protein
MTDRFAAPVPARDQDAPSQPLPGRQGPLPGY